MPREIPLQHDMFTGELVDTRSSGQKLKDSQHDQFQQLEMFKPREVLLFGVRANPGLNLLTGRGLPVGMELQIQDPRTEAEKETDRMRAAEAATKPLFEESTSAAFDQEGTEDSPEKQPITPDSLPPINRLAIPQMRVWLKVLDRLQQPQREAPTAPPEQSRIPDSEPVNVFVLTTLLLCRLEGLVELATEIENAYAPAAKTSPTPSLQPNPVLSEPRLAKQPGTGLDKTEPLGATPVYRQYREIKQQFPQAVVLFRMGDYYEAFNEDAELMARELEITLISRAVSKSQRVKMAGVPHEKAERYIAQLIANGHHVAICDQVGDKPVGGVLPREVMRVLAPPEQLSSPTLHKESDIEKRTMLPEPAGNLIPEVKTIAKPRKLGPAAGYTTILLDSLPTLIPY